MNLQVGKITPLGWKLAKLLPTCQPSLPQSHIQVSGDSRLAALPTWLPTFQPATDRHGVGVSRLEVGIFISSYRAVCPGLMPGTPAALSKVPNNNHKEEDAWAD